MTCLLCNQEFQEKIRFCDILFFRNNSRAICSSCSNQFERIGQMHCPNCYRQGTDMRCADCELWEKKGHKVNHRALYRYNPAMKDYFSKYKFEGDVVLGKVFAKELKKILSEYHDYTIVPVPISDERMKERQFNQVTSMLDYEKISYSELLICSDSEKQSSRNRQERLSNSTSFLLTEELVPEKIIVVDDIYTTGATLHEITSLFRAKGVQNVKTLSIAR